jgi:hypothetical protein
MKRLVIFVGVLLSLLVCIVPRTGPLNAAASDVERQIADMESRWAEAQKLGNADVVAPMVAAMFVNTDADGQT